MTSQRWPRTHSGISAHASHTHGAHFSLSLSRHHLWLRNSVRGHLFGRARTYPARHLFGWAQVGGAAELDRRDRLAAADRPANRGGEWIVGGD